MTQTLGYPFVIAMAQPGAQQNVWAGLIPFALMILIFYVLVLLPMRRRQKKIQEFQAGLKVSDKVITTSGIYGTVTRVSDVSVQLQIADKVRIEVARASIGGYQGQEPVVPPETAGN
ncbi:MAG TPA: preprotein translocase subunit YajC [Vicinamibacterales bacterium]|nr:preprotein translocase subunit YajC [Vicinamibacterales bacterium]